MSDVKSLIAKNVATLFEDGDVVNLGVGIPTMAVSYLPEDVKVLIHAECGVIGCGDIAKPEEASDDLVDAASVPITLSKEGSCFDSAFSFGIARGGHLSLTVLGGLQVDEEGNLANWMRPGQAVTGMGGAMDIVVGAKKVAVAMTHNTKNGDFKIVKKCTMPLTAVNVVTYVITELAILERLNSQFVVRAMANGLSKEELQARTGVKLVFDHDIKKMVE